VGDQGGQAVRLVKPHTYMNRSGAVLGLLRQTAELDLATELLVLVDDVALPAGRFRLRATGSAGGHHGLESLEAAVGGRDYARLRIGVGPKPAEVDLADFVLDPPTPEDHQHIQSLMDPMAEAVECWLSDGIERTMTRYNRWPHKENPDDDPVG
jgi:PTH1 family peptidyl-tRNA hydrolase